jgi:hypothetical protein
VLDAVAPISYSVAHEQLHHALAAYKRLSGEVADRLRLQLAAVIWRHLALHESCIAAAAGIDGPFALVTAVPSGEPAREQSHPLRWIVGEVVGPTRDRYERLLRPSQVAVVPRTFDPAKFAALRSLDAESVLLIDDTWTSGANAQSAAAALKSAGAGAVAVLVIGRHVNRGWRDNDRILRALPSPFDWTVCPLCAGPSALGRGPGLGDRRTHSVAPRLAVPEQHDLGVDRLDRVE